MSLKPPVAVVTGASSGIGAATAKLLAKNGYTVIAGARRLDRLEALSKFDSNIEIHQLDVTNQVSVDNFVKAVAGREVDLLVNNAGGAFDSSSVLDSDPEVWAKSYEVNVIGSVRMTKALAPSMITAGKGHIVIISSTAGHVAYENGGSYVAAKFAERSLANTLRLELNGTPIRVTEIAPGMVKTDEFALVRNAGDLAKAAKVYEGIESPLTAEDIAESIYWSTSVPAHVNIDSMVIRPVAQAANHKVFRGPLTK
jgi:NADP-dependent 3-hydroxy acid dehydrogenase YdfG